MVALQSLAVVTMSFVCNASVLRENGWCQGHAEVQCVAFHIFIKLVIKFLRSEEVLKSQSFYYVRHIDADIRGVSPDVRNVLLSWVELMRSVELCCWLSCGRLMQAIIATRCLGAYRAPQIYLCILISYEYFQIYILSSIIWQLRPVDAAEHWYQLFLCSPFHQRNWMNSSLEYNFIKQYVYSSRWRWHLTRIK